MAKKEKEIDQMNIVKNIEPKIIWYEYSKIPKGANVSEVKVFDGVKKYGVKK